MKLIIPEHLGDITLFQYQRWAELNDATNLPYKIHIFTDLPLDYCKSIKAIDAKRISAAIDKALTFSNEFTHRFVMKDIAFGFIPNLDKMTFAEYTDLQTYTNQTENLHRLMAILFRPIYKTDSKGNYAIMPYNGTESYAQIMLHTPMNIVNGAMVFFYNLTNELQDSTQKYLTQALMRDVMPKTISPISAGMQRLKSWLKTTFSKSTPF